MNIEFIIGTILGLIGAIPIIWQWQQKLRKADMSELMNRLVDKNLSQAKHRKVLRAINWKLRREGKHLKDEYIDNFVLGKRGKEAVFEDLCLQNRLEPTPELCRQFLKTDSPAIRDHYYRRLADEKSAATGAKPATGETPSAAKASNAPAATSGNAASSSRQAAEKKSPAPSVASPATGVSQAAGTSPAVEVSDCEVVYLSALLKERFPDTCARLVSLLGEHGIPCRFLEGTRDVWCRDYMPVQTASGKLVQFRYDPSYLRGKPEWEASRTDPAEACRANGITPDRISDINLDGGNILLCGGRAVISDRVFTENSDRDRQQLLAELSGLLEAEIILIPALKSDMTGHADGMVRFIDRTTLLGNDRALEYKYWSQGIDASLLQHAMRYEDVPFFYDYKDPKHPNHAIGVYVNYLAVGNLIVLPEFGVPGNKDAEALARIRALFPACTVVPFNCNDIALEGGLLNCITWTRRE